MKSGSEHKESRAALPAFLVACEDDQEGGRSRFLAHKFPNINDHSEPLSTAPTWFHLYSWSWRGPHDLISVVVLLDCSIYERSPSLAQH